jgi:hypothetical protein
MDTEQLPTRPRRWWRVAPVVVLALLAPWTAECSWGGFAAAAFPFVMVILAPLYGCAALLIRETARRTGGGWPTIILLAAAFGVLQAALIDQSLLNPDFLADTQFAGFADSSWLTRIPGLGVNARDVLDYVGNHIALSICAPIAIVESWLSPERRTRPWLGRRGLLVTGLLFGCGALFIYRDTAGRDGFTPTVAQLVGAGAVVAALVGTALLPRWRRRSPPVDRPAPHPAVVGAVLLAAQATGWLGAGWWTMAARVVAAAGAAVLIAAWSRRTGWGQPHVLAAWAAGLILAAVTAYTVPNYAPASPAAAVTGDIAVSLITAVLIVTAGWRLHITGRRGTGRRVPAAPPVPGW